MRADLSHLDKFKQSADHEGGWWQFGLIRVIASWGEGWDHVSVSLPNRCPTWAEMEEIKHRFFEPDEVAYQLHVPSSMHINTHEYCLHMWRPQASEIPLPPIRLV